MKGAQGASSRARACRRPAGALRVPWILALAAALLAMHAAGCSSSTPEKTVRDFIRARAAGDDHRAAGLTLEGDLGDYPGGEAYLSESDISLQVGPVSVEGDRATVTALFRWDGQEVEVPYVVRRAGSRWKVSLKETVELWLPGEENGGT